MSFFAQALRQAPISIGVSNRHGVCRLAPQSIDSRYATRPYSEGFTIGDGTRNAPFQYKSAAPVSPHYAIVDLWWRFCSQATANRPVFIQVNDWRLKVIPEGVVAENGHFTKLTP